MTVGATFATTDVATAAVGDDAVFDGVVIASVNDNVVAEVWERTEGTAVAVGDVADVHV